MNHRTYAEIRLMFHGLRSCTRSNYKISGMALPDLTIKNLRQTTASAEYAHFFFGRKLDKSEVWSGSFKKVCSV